MSTRRQAIKRPVSHSRIHFKHALPLLPVSCRLIDSGGVEVEVTEVDDEVQAEASQRSRDKEQREKDAKKLQKKAARWRTQPSKASLDSQESCVVA